jgi:hypothetical protein
MVGSCTVAVLGLSLFLPLSLSFDAFDLSKSTRTNRRLSSAFPSPSAVSYLLALPRPPFVFRRSLRRGSGSELSLDSGVWTRAALLQSYTRIPSHASTTFFFFFALLDFKFYFLSFSCLP